MDVIAEDDDSINIKEDFMTKSVSNPLQGNSAILKLSLPSEPLVSTSDSGVDNPDDSSGESASPIPVESLPFRFSITPVSTDAEPLVTRASYPFLEEPLRQSSELQNKAFGNNDAKVADEDEVDTLILDPSTLNNIYPPLPVEKGIEGTGPFAIKSSVEQKSLPSSGNSSKSLSNEEKEEVFNVSSIVQTTSNNKQPDPKSKNRKKNVSSGKKRNPNYDPFTLQGLFASFISMILFVLDYGSDIAVAISLNNEAGDTFWWLTLTIILIVVPSVIVSLFSLVWFQQDQRLHKKGVLPRKHVISGWERFLLIVCHIICIGPLVRECYIIRAGFKERKQDKKGGHLNILGPYCLNPKAASSLSADQKDHHNKAINYYSMRKYYERDAAYLGLIDSFIQDAPQLVLQLYILSVRVTVERADTTTAILQIFSVVMSLLSLSWAMISYESASRWADPEKPNVSTFGNIVQFLWRLLMTASRVLVLASFASVYPHELFIFGAAHWLLMAVWIFLMKTNFCGSVDNKRRPFAELIYNLVVGWVLIFDVIHVKEGPTRYKQAAYYVIMLLEMTALLFLWYFEITKEGMSGTNWIHQEWYQISLLSFVPSSFIVGLIFMAIFYTCYHPGGKMPAKSQKATLF